MKNNILKEKCNENIEKAIYYYSCCCNSIVGTNMRISLGSKEKYRLVVVDTLEGDVELVRELAEDLDIIEELHLIPDDKVIVNENAFLALEVDDDKHIGVESESAIVINATGNAKEGAVVIDLLYGKGTFVIDNPLSEKDSFKVKTSNASLSVRGTSFSVEYDKENDKTLVSVETGVVQVKNNFSGEEILLHEGESAVVESDLAPVVIEEQNTDSTDISGPTTLGAYRDIALENCMNYVSKYGLEQVQVFNAVGEGEVTSAEGVIDDYGNEIIHVHNRYSNGSQCLNVNDAIINGETAVRVSWTLYYNYDPNKPIISATNPGITFINYGIDFIGIDKEEIKMTEYFDLERMDDSLYGAYFKKLGLDTMDGLGFFGNSGYYDDYENGRYMIMLGYSSDYNVVNLMSEDGGTLKLYYNFDGQLIGYDLEYYK